MTGVATPDPSVVTSQYQDQARGGFAFDGECPTGADVMLIKLE